MKKCKKLALVLVCASMAASTACNETVEFCHGVNRCDENTLTICDGNEVVKTESCGDDAVCSAEEGKCIPKHVEDTCVAGTKQCVDNVPETCSEAGDWVKGESCGDDAVCMDGVCKAKACEPGKTECKDNATRTCKDDGSWGEYVKCDEGEACGESESGTSCLSLSPDFCGASKCDENVWKHCEHGELIESVKKPAAGLAICEDATGWRIVECIDHCYPDSMYTKTCENHACVADGCVDKGLEFDATTKLCETVASKVCASTETTYVNNGDGYCVTKSCVTGQAPEATVSATASCTKDNAGVGVCRNMDYACTDSKTLDICVDGAYSVELAQTCKAGCGIVNGVADCNLLAPCTDVEGKVIAHDELGCADANTLAICDNGVFDTETADVCSAGCNVSKAECNAPVMKDCTDVAGKTIKHDDLGCADANTLAICVNGAFDTETSEVCPAGCNVDKAECNEPAMKDCTDVTGKTIKHDALGCADSKTLAVCVNGAFDTKTAEVCVAGCSSVKSECVTPKDCTDVAGTTIKHDALGCSDANTLAICVNGAFDVETAEACPAGCNPETLSCNAPVMKDCTDVAGTTIKHDALGCSDANTLAICNDGVFDADSAEACPAGCNPETLSCNAPVMKDCTDVAGTTIKHDAHGCSDANTLAVCHDGVFDVDSAIACPAGCDVETAECK